MLVDLPIRPIVPARVNILHLNAQEIPETFAYLPDVFSRAYTIAIPYWELNRPAAVHTLGLASVDEIWAASKYLAQIFASKRSLVTRIGMSYDERDASREAGRAILARYSLHSDDFVFLTASDALSWVQRKNSLGTIEAFQAAFPADPTPKLVIKTHNLDQPLSAAQNDFWTRIREHCVRDPRMILINETFTPAEQRALLTGCDCLISLHRAEGLGLDILDSLHRGTPVVATGYSGNMDYCTDENAWLVDYDLLPVQFGQYPFVESGHVWAEPRMASAVTAMRGVFTDSRRRAQRVASGIAFVGEHASPAILATRISTRVEQILASAPDYDSEQQSHSPAGGTTSA
jgi:glycosyltransferase involved in cell wall biosynthesis